MLQDHCQEDFLTKNLKFHTATCAPHFTPLDSRTMVAYQYTVMIIEQAVPLTKVWQDVTNTLAGMDDPRREARWLLQALFSLSFHDFIASTSTLTPTQHTWALTMARRRKAGEPLARIVGHSTFWGESFQITPDVLEPRADSETMLITLQKLIHHLPFSPRILDFGTGSGCLLISTLREISNSHGFGVDKNIAALRVAAANARNLNVAARAQWIASDWDKALTGSFDLIISNPPYIRREVLPTLEKTVLEYDPPLALDGGEDGLDAYRQLIPAATRLLQYGGIALFEIGFDQGEDVQKLVQSPLRCRDVIKDIAGRNRLVFLEKPA